MRGCRKQRASKQQGNPVSATDGATEKSVGSVKGGRLGAVGSPEGPGCPQSPVCTGTSEEGLPNKSLYWGFPKARRLRQFALSFSPCLWFPLWLTMAQSSWNQPAWTTHRTSRGRGKGVEKAGNGWGGGHRKEGLHTVQSPFKPSYKSHGTWLQRIFKMPPEFSSSQLTKDPP